MHTSILDIQAVEAEITRRLAAPETRHGIHAHRGRRWAIRRHRRGAQVQVTDERSALRVAVGSEAHGHRQLVAPGSKAAPDRRSQLVVTGDRVRAARDASTGELGADPLPPAERTTRPLGEQTRRDSRRAA